MFDFNKAKVVGVTVPTIEQIPDSEGLLSYAARVSNPNNQDNFETANKLLGYCAKHNHWSVFEMCNVVIEVETPRDIARQLLRHRSFSFQEFCITGDSLITTVTEAGRSKKVKIEDLYKRYQSSQYWGNSDNLVRVYDEESKLLKSAKIKEVFKTGKKDVFKITLEDGKVIESTQEHKFLTNEGFKELSKINIGDFVGVNGVAVHQDKSWLENAKKESLLNGGLSYVAEKAGVSYHTIRKWLKRHGLQYTKKEVATYTEAWNKGLPREEQPLFGKFHNAETRSKMSDSARKGAESNLYSSGNYSSETIAFRRKVAQFCSGYKRELLKDQNYKCAITGDDITYETCEVDHKIPVYSNPEKAFDMENLQVVTKEAHFEKSQRESLESKTTVRFKKVLSIKYVGEKETYDLEVDHDSHNYIANGIVTHNSQRYAKAQSFCVREARMQDEKNRQNSIVTDDDQLAETWESMQETLRGVVQTYYDWAIDNGIAKEVARTILPEGNTMSYLYVNGTVRSWMHYCQLRRGNGTQLEHIDLADKCAEQLKDYFPSLAEHFGDSV